MSEHKFFWPPDPQSMICKQPGCGRVMGTITNPEYRVNGQRMCLVCYTKHQAKKSPEFRALDVYNAHYDNAAYIEIEHQALLVAEPAAIWDLGRTQTPSEVVEFMNTVIDAAFELCGSSLYLGSTVRAAILAYSYGDAVLDATDEFLAAFVKS